MLFETNLVIGNERKSTRPSDRSAKGPATPFAHTCHEGETVGGHDVARHQVLCHWRGRSLRKCAIGAVWMCGSAPDRYKKYRHTSPFLVWQVVQQRLGLTRKGWGKCGLLFKDGHLGAAHFLCFSPLLRVPSISQKTTSLVPSSIKARKSHAQLDDETKFRHLPPPNPSPGPLDAPLRHPLLSFLRRGCHQHLGMEDENYLTMFFIIALLCHLESDAMRRKYT